MLFATALKDGVVGPDWTGKNYTYKLDESRLIREDQRGYYDQVPECFSVGGSHTYHLTSAQLAAGATGVAGIDEGGNLFGVDGEVLLSERTNTIGLFKPWPSAGSNVSGTVSEQTSNNGTTFIKQKLSGLPRRVRAVLTHVIIRQPFAYSQSGTALTITDTFTAGLAVGELVYIFPQSGGASAGWYPVASVNAGVSITVTMPVSMTTSGNLAWSKGIKGVRVTVALTETDTNATVANLATPTVGGVGFNVPADSANPFGWRYVDFTTAKFVNPNFTNGQANAAEIVSNLGVCPAFAFASEWVNLPTVNALDGKGANFLARIYHEATVSGTRSALSGGDLLRINNPAIQSAMGVGVLDWWRTNWQASRSGINAISTLTSLPVNTNAGTGFYVAFEFDYAVPCTSVAVYGDSTTAHSKYEWDYGPANTFTASFSGTTMTLTSDITSSQSGAGSIPYPIQAGQPLTFTGQVNNSDTSSVCVTGLVSGTNGVSGAVYSLSASQTTASGVTVTVGVNTIQNWSSWAVQAVYGKSTPEHPYDLYNGGMAGRQTPEIFGQLAYQLNQGVVPQIVLLTGYSTNNAALPTVNQLELVRGQILDAIYRCRQAGVQRVLVATWPLTTAVLNNSTVKARVDAHNDWIRKLAIDGVSDGCPDFEAVRQSQGDSVFYSPDGNPFYRPLGDGIHMGKAGVAGMKDEIIKFI